MTEPRSFDDPAAATNSCAYVVTMLADADADADAEAGLDTARQALAVGTRRRPGLR
jgi:hypothetical protein